MAIELNADLAKFQTFMSELGREDSTSVQLGADRKTLGVATKTAGRLSRAISPFKSTSEARTENNRVRAEFLKAVTFQFGGRLANIPKPVMDALRIKDYELDVSPDGNVGIMSGKPLTARRIAQVLEAVKTELAATKSLVDDLSEAPREDYNANLASVTGLSLMDLAGRIVKAARAGSSPLVLESFNRKHDSSEVLDHVITVIKGFKEITAQSGKKPSPAEWKAFLDKFIADLVEDGYERRDGRFKASCQNQFLQWLAADANKPGYYGLEKYDVVANLGRSFDSLDDLYGALRRETKEAAARATEDTDIELITTKLDYMRNAFIPAQKALQLIFPANSDNRHLGLQDVGEGLPLVSEKDRKNWCARGLGLDRPSDPNYAIGAIAGDVLRGCLTVRLGDGAVQNVTARARQVGGEKAATDLALQVRDYIQSGMSEAEKEASKNQVSVVCQALSQNGRGLHGVFNKQNLNYSYRIEKGKDGQILLHYESGDYEAYRDKDHMENCSNTYVVNRDGTTSLIAFEFKRWPVVDTEGSRSRIMDVYEGRATSAHFSAKANEAFRTKMNEGLLAVEKKDPKMDSAISENDWGELLAKCKADMKRNRVIIIGERRFGEGGKVSEQDIAEFKAAVISAFTKDGVTNHRAIRQFFMLAGQQGANLVEDMKNVDCSPVPVFIKKSPMKDRAHKDGTEVRLTTDKATGEYRLDEDYYNEAGVMFSKNNIARQVDIDNTKSPLHDHYTYAFDGKGPARLGGDVTFDINLESNGVMDAFGA